MIHVNLINESFTTEKKNRIDIKVEYSAPWYKFSLIKNNTVLGRFEIPDNFDTMDIPVKNEITEDTSRDVREAVTEFLQMINKLKK